MMWAAAGGITLACMAAGFLMGMLAERWHGERREFDAEIEQHEQQLAERRATGSGRHRASTPRTSPPPAAPRPPWDTQGIDTVLLAPEPAPPLNGTADTGTIPRVQLPDDTTGAIRAVGDELVAKIERGELV